MADALQILNVDIQLMILDWVSMLNLYEPQALMLVAEREFPKNPAQCCVEL